jgi:hypothetical protein
MMNRRIHLAFPAFALLAGTCMLTPAGAQSVVITPAPAPVQSQVIVPAPVESQSAVVIAPSAPPPPRLETIPPPPSVEPQAMDWRPGHWRWDGVNWAWASGDYVQRPQPQAVWEPGHWAQQPTGGYVWVDGHWQG